MRLKDYGNASEQGKQKMMDQFLHAMKASGRVPPARECPECKKVYHFMQFACPDMDDHERLGVKCCHWGDIEVEGPSE